jgi:hypothetical protein
MRKYNKCHDGMLSNYRSQAKQSGFDSSHLTNEELFAIVEYWSGVPTGEETEERVLDDIKNKVKR